MNNVHRDADTPSFSYWPNQQKNNRLLRGASLQRNDPTPFMYANDKQGPPPGMNCSVGMRYDPQSGWYCPTAPCYSAPPNDRSLCDVHTGQWYVPTVQGQVGNWGGPAAPSLINMAPCAIDRNYEPPVGTRGKPTCDRLTGRYFYDSNDGNDFTMYDGQSLAAFASYKNTRDGVKKMRGGLIGTNALHYGIPSVAMDRAYIGPTRQPFQMPDGRLHPMLTGMGYATPRARGHYQKNSNILPVSKITARVDPSSRQPRGGFMRTASLDEPTFANPTEFNSLDVQRATDAQIAQRQASLGANADAVDRPMFVHKHKQN